MPVCGVFETSPRKMGRCRLSWTCVREEERNESRTKGREMGRDAKRSDASHPPRVFPFLSPDRRGSTFPHGQQTTRVIKAPLYQSKMRRPSPAAPVLLLLLVTRPDLRLPDRDAALISTDAKDLKVSFGITHHG